MHTDFNKRHDVSVKSKHLLLISNNSEFLFPSMPVSLTEKISFSTREVLGLALFEVLGLMQLFIFP